MKDPRLCVTKRCRNDKEKQRKLCWKCTKRRYKKRHPLRNCFNVLKNNAKRRGKEFNLTIEQFRKFAIETSYINKRGRTARKFHIDRIDNSMGYSINNIQSITSSMNAKKRHYEYLPPEEIDCPF